MNTHTHTQITWTQPVPHESPQCPFQLPAQGTNCPDLWDFDAFVLLVNGIMSSFVGSSFHSTFCLWDPVTLLPVVVHYLSSRLVIPHCVTTPHFISSILLLFFFFFFSSTSLLLPTHLPPLSCTHAQSCNPMDFSPPDSSVHGFFQARTLEWVVISFSICFTLNGHLDSFQVLPITNSVLWIF